MNYQEIFNELINTPRSGTKYLSKLVEYDKSNPCKYKVILAVDKDEDNQQCVMLQLKNGGDQSKIIINNINTINSINVEVMPADSGAELDVYYSVKLLQNTDDKIFYTFISDIIATAQSSNSNLPVIDILKRIKIWINFFKSKSSFVLTENNQIGLFAELNVLKILLQNNPNKLKEAILCWGGPKGKNQDFVFSNRAALEVKCTTSNNPFEISISNELQLDNTDFDIFYLSVCHAKRHKINQGTSFPSLPLIVSQIKHIVSHNSEAKYEFDALLIEAGYFIEAEIEYLNYGFQILKGPIFYEVNDAFPKLTRALLPNSINKVSYRLNLQDQKEISGNVFTLLNV